jgi:hypothetical protein
MMKHHSNMLERGEEFAEILSTNRKYVDNNIFNYILKVVEMYSEVEGDFYYRKTRKTEYVRARHLAMYFTKKYTKLPLKSIGKKFKKDHSTVIHGIGRIENGIKYEKIIKESVKNLEQIINTRVNAMLGDVNIERDYYYIDLNNIYSLKIDDTKSIILNGFNQEEAYLLMNSFKIIKEELKEHKNTGMYILEKRYKNGNTEEE